MTRGERRLAREGVTVRLVDGNDHDAVERALDALHRLHDGRWGDTSEFLDEWTSVAAALRRGAAAGAVRFGELVVAGSDAAGSDAADSDAAGGEGSADGKGAAAGETIAVEVDLVVGSRAAFYQAGRLTDHRWRASGSVLRMALVRSAIESGCVDITADPVDMPRAIAGWVSDPVQGRHFLSPDLPLAAPHGLSLIHI